MYIVQASAVDVEPDVWRNIGEELTAADVKKIGPERLKRMLTTHRVVEIENLSEPVKEKPKAKVKTAPAPAPAPARARAREDEEEE